MAMHHETHHIILAKQSSRQLRENVIESNIKNILDSVNTKSLAVRGWTMDVVPFMGQQFKRMPSPDRNAEYLYNVTIAVKYTQAKEPDRNDIHAILRTIYTRARQPNFGQWILTGYNEKPYTPPTDQDIATSDDMIGYAEVSIPGDWDSYFTHLYGLDHHIGRIKKALEAGIASNWTNRFHCVLQGPPGCGKSDISQTVKAALGDDAVLEFDATATTAAGAIKELTEREILPRVLIVEEIEKAEEKAMSFLLSVCDLRAQIRKTTARNTIQRDTRLFVIATVNDVELFDRLQAGALSSRFANKIKFKRPSREMRARILAREINKINGDLAWIQPALDYCEKHDIDDPRVITALTLCGAEGWLDGTYETMLDATSDDNTITDMN